MRQLLILIAASLPLAALTGWSVWRAATAQTPSAADADKSETAAIAERAQHASAEAKQSGELAKSLPQIDLLETTGPELPDWADDKLKEAWNDSIQARRLVSQFARLGHIDVSADASLRSRRREAETVLARLREFIASQRPNYVGQLTGADDFFAMLDGRAKQIEMQIAGYRREDDLADAEAAAKRDLDEGRYDACLKRLDSEPLAKATDTDQIDRLKLLRAKAQYRLDWDEIDHQGLMLAGGELFNKMQAFLRKYPDPPSPAERDLQVQLERRRDRLKSEMSVHVLDEARDLDVLLAEASQIIANNQVEESVKQHARHEVKQWLQRHLPKIEAPASLLGKQEAVTKSGQRKMGAFFLPEGGEQYRFWLDRRRRAERPRGDEQIPRGAFAQPPGKPQYVVWADQYNERVAGLFEASAGHADWQQFADDCDEWQQQLAAYREQWGVDDEPDRSCREWSFRNAAGLARNLLRHWAEYQRILSQPE